MPSLVVIVGIKHLLSGVDLAKSAGKFRPSLLCKFNRVTPRTAVLFPISSGGLILDCSFQKEYKEQPRQHEWRDRKSSIGMKFSIKPWRFSGRAVTREHPSRIW